MLLNPGTIPVENHSKITPIGRNDADYYVVIVVKFFNSKCAVLNGINRKAETATIDCSPCGVYKRT